MMLFKHLHDIALPGFEPHHAVFIVKPGALIWEHLLQRLYQGWRNSWERSSLHQFQYPYFCFFDFTYAASRAR